MADFTDYISPNLQKVAREFPDAARDGLFLGAEHVLGVSNDQVPYEEGDFSRWGRTSVSDSELVAAVSYRDTAFRGQAEVLHEDLQMRHDEGRNAKFLENALNSERTAVRAIVAIDIQRRLGL